MSALRFCMVTTFYPPYHFGGDAVFVQRLARALARRGHRVTVAHDRDAWRALRRGPEPLPQRELDGIEVIDLESGWGSLSPLLTHQTGHPFLNAGRLARLLDRGRFDVIHYHNVSLVGGPAVLEYGSALKLYTAHEHWLVCPTHVLWRNNRELCTGRRCVRCALAYRRPPQLWRYTHLLERAIVQVDRFIAPSEFARRKHAEFGFSPDMEVLPHFVPAPEPIAETGPPHPRPYFLYAGRLERLKGLQRVIPKMDHVPGTDLLVAGDGEYAAELRRLAAGSPQVKFLGRLPGLELDRLYRDAIAVLIPSIGFETFGTVAIEAFRQSTPVIARALGALPEIVTESGGGLCFGNDDEMTQAMTRLACDRALRERLGSAGFDAFQVHWTEGRHLERYFSLIERLRGVR